MAKSKPTPPDTTLFTIDVLKNSKKIKTESITVDGVMEAHQTIKRMVQNKGPVDVAEWKRQAYKMTAVRRCRLVFETGVAIDWIKNGRFDGTPAIEMTASNSMVALSEVNQEFNISCNKGH